MDELIQVLLSFHTSDELVLMLEITPEELLERFPDKVEEHKEKFISDEEDIC